MVPTELSFERALFLLLVAFPINLLTAYFLPKFLDSKAGINLYVQATWMFDQSTRFDNTFLTYGTDYFLAVITFLGAASILSSCGDSKMCRRCALLLTLYCISVTSGGYAHQFIDNVKDMNSLFFRVIWTCCVGTVTLAGGAIGAVGTQFASVAAILPPDQKRFTIPIIPEWFWIFWGVSLTVMVWFGALSMKRPACDIFVAGVTQTFPSTYVFLSLISRKWGSFKPRSKDNTSYLLGHNSILMMVGFYSNAPLIFLYPWLVSLGLSLGVVNCFLHLVLCFSWCLQLFGMKGFSMAFSVENTTAFLCDARTQKKVENNMLNPIECFNCCNDVGIDKKIM